MTFVWIKNSPIYILLEPLEIIEWAVLFHLPRHDEVSCLLLPVYFCLLCLPVYPVYRHSKHVSVYFAFVCKRVLFVNNFF
jgi:hypothetical protein